MVTNPWSNQEPQSLVSMTGCISHSYFRYHICKHNSVTQKIPTNCSKLNYHKLLYIYYRRQMQQKEWVTSQRKIIKGQSAAISVLKVTELVLSVSFLFPLNITYFDKKKCLSHLHQFCQFEESTQYLTSELFKFG